MDRGFFQHKQEFVSYRRNYFQISCGILGPDLESLIVKSTNLPILGFQLSLKAKVKDEDLEISLIQHTPKRDKGPMHDPEPKSILPGGNPFLQDANNNGLQIATFERIQFKSATANNGKRKAAQQYFCLVIDLHARTVDGDVHIGYCESNALIVRGRSPSHYSDHNQLVALSANPDSMVMMNSAGYSPYPMSATRFSFLPVLISRYCLQIHLVLLLLILHHLLLIMVIEMLLNHSRDKVLLVHLKIVMKDNRD